MVIACATLSPLARAEISFAPNGAGLTIGDGNNVTVYGAAIHWDSLCSCPALKQYGFDTRLVAQVAYWRGREHPAERNSLWDVSLIPMLRWTAPQVVHVTMTRPRPTRTRALTEGRRNARHFLQKDRLNGAGTRTL